MKIVKKFLVLSIASLIAAGSLFGCDREGPAERTGENIDRSIERGQERVGESLDREGPAERAGERLDRPVERD